MIILGVGGGIAAYKAADLLRKLVEAGNDVRVVPTASALNFVGAPTWAALSHHPVAADVWTDADAVPHVQLGRRADGTRVVTGIAEVQGREGDTITFDIPKRELRLEVADDEIARRLREVKQPEPRFKRGVFAKYANTVSSASEGAVTS